MVASNCASAMGMSAVTVTSRLVPLTSKVTSTGVCAGRSKRTSRGRISSRPTRVLRSARLRSPSSRGIRMTASGWERRNGMDVSNVLVTVVGRAVPLRSIGAKDPSAFPMPSVLVSTASPGTTVAWPIDRVSGVSCWRVPASSASSIVKRDLVPGVMVTSV
jgi:hypothetical protein